MGKVVVRGEAARQRVIEILKNGGSLDEAAEKTGYGRNYCRQLGAKVGIRFSRGKYKTNYDIDLIVSLCKTGISTKEISTIANCPTWKINQIRADAGLPKQNTVFQQEVKNLREQGLCCVEIADKLGKPTASVRQAAAAIGMPFTHEEVKKSLYLGGIKGASLSQQSSQKRAPSKEQSRKFVEDNYSEWLYVDGYFNSDGFMSLQCSKCGEIIKKSSCSVRHKYSLICPICQQRQRQEKERLKEQLKEQKNKERCERKAIQFWGQDFEQLSFKICKQCGQPFYYGKKYCSDECRKKATNSRHDKRIQRAKKIDISITLKKLYHRDKGVCWICGEACDYNDCRVDGLGNFIVGKNYPSIDHVFPLSKGGSHTWDNVKLAHHYCNTLKNNKVVS